MNSNSMSQSQELSRLSENIFNLIRSFLCKKITLSEITYKTEGCKISKEHFIFNKNKRLNQHTNAHHSRNFCQKRQWSLLFSAESGGIKKLTRSLTSAHFYEIINEFVGKEDYLTAWTHSRAIVDKVKKEKNGIMNRVRAVYFNETVNVIFY